MARGQKRVRKRVPKEKRRNLRLWAEGAREQILTPHLDAYQQASDQGRRQERKYWKKVCREFHARVDWRTEDHEEPILSEWDPAATVVEEVLSAEDEQARSARVDILNKRIRRWFTYRLKKLRKRQRSGLDPTKDPFAVLLAKLSGLSAPPKARQAYQQFMHESYTDKVAPVVAEEWRKLRETNSEVSERTKEPKAGFRAQVARNVFAALPVDEQKALAARAKKEAADAKAAYISALKNPPSQSPVARQKCIDSVADFMGPILRGLQEYTGLHSTLIMGGPIPKYGRELRTVHALAPHWPQWDRPRFAEVTKFMTEYLKTAFTTEECAQSALTVDLSEAPYTIKNSVNDSDSESDSDSEDSSSESSDSESSEEEEEGHANKRRKLSAPGGKSSGKGGKQAKPRAKPSTSFPASSSDALPAPHPADTTLVNPSNDDDDDDADADADLAPNPNRWWATPEERAQNLARNAQLLADLKADISPAMASLKAELRANTEQMEKAKPKRRAVVRKKYEPSTDAPAPRRSSRQHADSVMDSSAGNSRLGAMEVDTAMGATGSSSSLPPAADNANSPLVAMATAPSTAEAVSVSPMPCPASESQPSPPLVPATSTTSSPDAAPPSTTPPALGDPPNVATSLAPVSHAAQAVIVASTTMPTQSHQLSAGPSTFAPCPPKAAKWFADAHAAMTRVDLGCHYHALVDVWARMEEASRFEHGPTNLPSKFRPIQVTTWISRSRRGIEPSVTDPSRYAIDWQVWWDSLQPSWRKKNANGEWIVVDGYGGGGREWGPLYQWGVNGVLSIVASLSFWGQAVQDTPELRLQWERAVVDVGWMFEGMAKYYEMFKGKF
ncbi:hypothetical protein C8R45DRAFT_1133146 [Mycena sanguinolenta]|nr:hypothetical protein C8R45DRAFT_1133146 [Mycena sanguinolenta]